MPQNTLTIRFKAEGKDELKAAFAALGNASKKLAVDQEKLKQALSKVDTQTKKTIKTHGEYGKGLVRNHRNLGGITGALGKFGKASILSGYGGIG